MNAKLHASFIFYLYLFFLVVVLSKNCMLLFSAINSTIIYQREIIIAYSVKKHCVLNRTE